MQTSFCSNPLESCLVKPTTLEYNLNEEFGSLYSLLDTSEIFELSRWTPKFKELPPNENKFFSSNFQPPALELKVLPSNLKYIFLGEEETFPVVISSSLNSNQEAELLAVLKSYKNSIGWNVVDIKSINSLIKRLNIVFT